MNSDPLKYRFRAEYADGEVFAQNAADVSAIDPLRSAFFDVDHARLRTFSLWSDEGQALVDLTDGHFEVANGIDAVFRFVLHDPRDVVGPFRLVFFRRNRKHIRSQHKLDDDGIWRQETAWEDAGHEITFRLGWEADTPEGGTIQRVMEFQ